MNNKAILMFCDLEGTLLNEKKSHLCMMLEKFQSKGEYKHILNKEQNSQMHAPMKL